MARKKTITKEQILDATYDIIMTEGFAGFTARNIATKMKCSTQPIYLEFKNMNDLKIELFKKIEEYLYEKVFDKVVTGHPFIDTNLNYIHFACEQSTLYRALYLEGHSGNDILNQFSRKVFMEGMEKEPSLQNLSEGQKEAVFSGTWIVATGIATLSVGSLIQPTDEEIMKLLNDVIKSVVANDFNQILTNVI